MSSAYSNSGVKPLLPKKDVVITSRLATVSMADASVPTEGSVMEITPHSPLIILGRNLFLLFTPNSIIW
jgi:hypothetical protein